MNRLPRPSRLRRGVSAGAALLALVTLIVVGAIVAITAASGSDDEAGTAPDPVADHSAATKTAATEPSIGPEVVRSALLAYVRAYDSEDAEAAGATMSADVTRHSAPSSAQYGRADVMSEYQRQFDALVSPQYVLDQLSITTTPEEARASARYTITSDQAPSSTGSIVFYLVLVGDRLLIDEITAVPD